MTSTARPRASDSRPSVRTQRAAIELACQAYERLYAELAIEGDDAEEVSAFAASVFSRGLASLMALQGRVSDVSLSSDGSEAVVAYLKSLETRDLDRQLAWLGMFPQLLREVVRRANVTAPEFRIEFKTQRLEVRTAEASLPEWNQTITAGNNQSALARAA